MPKKSDVLKMERSQKLDAQKALSDKAKTEKRDFTPEEETQFDATQGEIEALDVQIERSLKMEKNEIDIANRQGRLVGDKGDGEEGEQQRMAKRFSLHRGIHLMYEGKTIDGVEGEIHAETSRQAKLAGVAVGGFAVPDHLARQHAAPQRRFAGQSVTQDSGEYGAALVDSEMQELVPFLRPRPVLESMGATFLTGLQADLRFPVNEGGITASWEGEVDAGALSKNKYSNKTMKPKRLVSAVPLSIQNIIQSSPDLEKLTLDEINAVMANALDLAAINGSGTGDQPLGILNTSGVPVIAIGTNGGAITWPNIVGMETSVFVENANSAKMAYLINSVTKGKLKTTKHESGDLNYLMTMMNEINGYPVGVSNLVPGNITKGTGTNLSAAIFGDFSQVRIGQWGFVDLTIDKSTAISGYFTLVVNAFYDVLVRQPKSFTIIKDISNA